MSETQINASVSEKLKRTRTNMQNSSAPDITGRVLGDFHADRKMAVPSGEADIYLCSGRGPYAGQRFILKYYRRKGAVKPEVIEKLSHVNSPCVAPVISFGEYEGHQYAVIPFYENPSLAQALVSGEHFSENELRGFIIPSVIEGLKALHDAGILHKDIKPGNLIPDDACQHVVLIDFGISSAAGNNTLLVTSTGMTPAYAAPEALQGIFHKETDYYALGITVFELFTGFTPFQNPGLSPEETARLAAFSNIEFPADFPPRLKDLVRGLTCKDISRRHEQDNPNRRWGYNEVRRWLNGEDVPVPDENSAQEPKQKFLPYKFSGVFYQTPESLVKALLKDPASGIREAGRGILTHHFSLFAPDLEQICREAEEILQNNTDGVLSHQVFCRLMYRLAPELKTVFCGGREFGSLTELGAAAVTSAISGNASFVSELRLLQDSFLEFFAGSILKSAAAAAILKKVSLQISQEERSDTEAAWILGYALSDKRNIRIGDQVFCDPAELLGYFKRLESEKGFLRYFKYLKAHREELEFFSVVIPEANARESLKLALEDLNQAIFGKGELHFKNAADFDGYIENLRREKDACRLSHILSTYDAALKEVSIKVWQSASYEKLRSIVSGFVMFEGEIFLSAQDLKEYLAEHRKTPEFIQTSARPHSSDLTPQESGIAVPQAVACFPADYSPDPDKQESITIKGGRYPRVKPMRVKVGEYVKFGRYPQNNGKAKEPIEWLVLEVKGKEALVVSRYGLDNRQYHNTEADITWENSDLRKWLNRKFLKTAFTEAEQERIRLSEVVNDVCNPQCCSSGNNTQDRVFCLSVAEAERYFTNKAERRCMPTEYAGYEGAWTDDNTGCCWWWLRSTGIGEQFASYVIDTGSIFDLGCNIIYDRTVRPAFWLIWDL